MSTNNNNDNCTIKFNNILKNKLLIKYILSYTKKQSYTSRVLSWNQLLSSSKHLIYYGFTKELGLLLDSLEKKNFLAVFECYIEPYLRYAVKHYNLVVYLFERYGKQYKHILWLKLLKYSAINNQLYVFRYLMEIEQQEVQKDNKILKSELELSLKFALENGNLEMFTSIYSIYKCNEYSIVESRLIQQIFESIAKSGRVDVLEYIMDEWKLLFDLQSIPHIIEIASLYKHSNIIYFILDRYNSINNSDNNNNSKITITLITLGNIVKYGDLELLKILLNEYPPKTSYYEKLVDEAAYYNHIDLIEWIFNQGIVNCYKDAFDIAAERGHLAILEYLHNHPSIEVGYTSRAMNGAAMIGRLDIIKFLYENGYRNVTIKAMNHAARRGHIDVVKYLHNTFSLELKWSDKYSKSIEYASLYNHFEIVEFLHSNSKEPISLTALLNASKAGNLKIFRYIYEDGNSYFDLKRIKDVSLSPNMEIVRYLSLNLQLEKYHFDQMAKRGLLENMKFYIKKMGQYESSIYIAAKSGNLEMVQYLIKTFRITQLNGNIFSQVVSENRLNILDYFIDNKFISGYISLDHIFLTLLSSMSHGCCYAWERIILKMLSAPHISGMYVSDHILRNSVYRSKINMLLVASNYRVLDLGNQLIDYAVLNHDFQAILYLQSFNLNLFTNHLLRKVLNCWCDYSVFKHLFETCLVSEPRFDFPDTISKACEIGSLGVISLIYENMERLHQLQHRFIFTKIATELACGHGHLSIVQFLHSHEKDLMEKYQHSTLFSKSCMDSAAGGGHLEVVKFLHINRTEGCTVSAIDKAALYGHLEVLKFLFENRTEGYSLNLHKSCSSKVRDWINFNIPLNKISY